MVIRRGDNNEKKKKMNFSVGMIAVDGFPSAASALQQHDRSLRGRQMGPDLQILPENRLARRFPTLTGEQRLHPGSVVPLYTLEGKYYTKHKKLKTTTFNIITTKMH